MIKSLWQKVFNTRIYPFLSKKDFGKRRRIIEYVRSESPPNLHIRYTPVNKIKAVGEIIYVYNLDVLQGKHEFYNNTRVYFRLYR